MTWGARRGLTMANVGSKWERTKVLLRRLLGLLSSLPSPSLNTV